MALLIGGMRVMALMLEGMRVVALMLGGMRVMAPMRGGMRVMALISGSAPVASQSRAYAGIMSDTTRDRQHAESFRENADGYDAHRPSYPVESVRWLLDAARDVVDVGAGTGKLTAELVALGASVTAIDPAADMLRVLGERLPQVETVEGSAEHLPIPDACADLVTFARPGTGSMSTPPPASCGASCVPAAASD